MRRRMCSVSVLNCWRRELTDKCHQASMDGYPYTWLGEGGSFDRLTPDISSDDLPSCTISYDECFGGYSRASDVLKHIAFENPQCGDCGMCLLLITN